MELTEKTGRVQVTFGSFGYVEKYFVRFKPNELDDTHTVSLYKDARYMTPFQEETFTSSDVCGLDWGTFELQKKVLKYFYKPSKLCTYLTIITKTKSISFVFSGDEGEQCKEWKNAIQKFLYKGKTYIREKLKHEGDDAMLQVGNLNIALTKDRRRDQPAYTKLSWPKTMFYDCQLDGRAIKMIMKAPNAPCATEVLLECLRGACEDTKILSREETVARIRTTLFEFVVCYWFTKEKIYEDLQDGIYTDIESDIFDLNQLHDFSCGGSEEVRQNMHNLYKKFKDNENHYTEPNSPIRPFSIYYDKNDQFILNAGYAIQQIKANPPRPDTLCLSNALRANICYRLYKETQIERTGDWTALASEIGKSACNI